MPRRLIVDPDDPRPDALVEVTAVLRAGGVVAYPTDTLYGLAVDPRNGTAVARLYEVKGRGGDLPIPLIAADVTQVEQQVGALTGLDRRLADRFWPGPLSLVVQAHAALAPGVAAPDGTVAVRVPAHDVARAIARVAGHPITATSANRSGGATAATAGDVLARLGATVDLVIDAGPSPGGPPSTIVRVRGREVTLVRAGAIAWERVLELQQ
jgi:L-threonylcarbamoyladenylate synthase